MKQDRELTLTIDNESNSYLRQHGTDSNGVRWCTIEVANECMARIQQELDAARRDVDALRQRSLVNSRVADGRLKEIERLRGALHRINDFRSNDNDDFAEFACKTAEQALAAQQEAG